VELVDKSVTEKTHSKSSLHSVRTLKYGRMANERKDRSLNSFEEANQ